MAKIGPYRFRARRAGGAEDVRAAQMLRGRVFRGGAGVDADPFDEICQHVLIEESATGTPVACFRVQIYRRGADIGRGYAAQFYDLGGLAAYGRPLAELGRFCVDPAWRAPDILRVAWSALTGLIDRAHVGMLFGCTSFVGTDPTPYGGAFAYLAAHHLGPVDLRPGVGAARVVAFPNGGPGGPRPAMGALPPLLRSYLGMGGWVGDHAVIDEDLGTIHVFTALEIDAIPPARARALRSLAALART